MEWLGRQYRLIGPVTSWVVVVVVLGCVGVFVGALVFVRPSASAYSCSDAGLSHLDDFAAVIDRSLPLVKPSDVSAGDCEDVGTAGVEAHVNLKIDDAVRETTMSMACRVTQRLSKRVRLSCSKSGLVFLLWVTPSEDTLSLGSYRTLVTGQLTAAAYPVRSRCPHGA